MNEIIIRVKNLTKYYDGKLALEIPELDFEAGKIYAIVGPNGSGKTTLLNLLAGLDEPTGGAIFFRERKIAPKSISVTNARRQITLVMQEPVLFHTTVEKNIAYGLRLRKMGKEARGKKVVEALKMVGLSGFEKRKGRGLSAGEVRRVAIARALVLEPKALLLDEPTANIDKRNAEVIEELIQKIKSENRSVVIMTTHDLSRAYCLADNIISLFMGRIIDNSPENIFPAQIEESNGTKLLSLSPSVKIPVHTEKKGSVYACISPQSIRLVRQPIELDSCQKQRLNRCTPQWNYLPGDIISIASEKESVRLKIDVGVEFVALIEKQQFDEMNLNIGIPIHVAFKDADVQMFDSK